TGSFGSSSCILYNKVKNKVKISGVDVGRELDHFNTYYKKNDPVGMIVPISVGIFGHPT
ncbi:hypothetical protein HKBW3S33_02298, partial [Candidatus Hakubella thermalkaliphila]